MIVIGIDPGTLITGYGIIELQGARLHILDLGIIQNRSSMQMPLRLHSIYATISTLISTYHPNDLAIETAFFSKNVQSALKIGQARGVAMLAGVNAGLAISEYSPREVKKAVVGNGAASKEQVQYMMVHLFRLQNPPRHLDTTDALAVAVCHCHRLLKPQKRFRDWKLFIDAHPERVICDPQKTPRPKRTS